MVDLDDFEGDESRDEDDPDRDEAAGRCEECETWGEFQCRRHADAALAQARAESLDWPTVQGERAARVARRHGVALSAEEVRAVGVAVLEAAPDPLEHRADIQRWRSCPRCRVGLECGCEIPF